MESNRRLLIRRLVYILVGSFLFSYTINALFIPHGLLSGGLTGIAIMIEYLFKIPAGVSVLLLNIPLFIGGYKFVSKRFTYLSIYGTILVSIFLFLTAGWTIQVENTMIASIFGGLIVGVGTGMVIKNRGSMGGIDILSIIVNKYFSLSISGVGMAFNAIILIAAAFLFQVEMAMYTLVAIFVGNKALDAILEGFNRKKTLIVVTDKNKEMAQELFKHTRRGITFLNGEGAYTGKEKQLIYMVVRTMELTKIRDIIRSIDPDAFVSIIETKEVEGRGFQLGDLF